MKIFSLIIVVATGLCLTCSEIQASSAFVTDTFRISLRRGPGIENKILEFLPSGQPVEILEAKEDWSRVQPIDPDKAGPEGWVLSRYLITRQPWKAQYERLKEENDRLINDLYEIQKRYDEVRQREQELSSEVQKYNNALSESRTEYHKLKADASDYLELKSVYEILQRKAVRLERENDELYSSQRNRWFALGALILLCGLMIGLIFGKQEKKRKGYY